MSGTLCVLGISGASGGFTANLNRTSLVGFKLGIPTVAQTSRTVTCTPIGGKPPYSYVWAKVSGDTGIGNTSSSNTTYFARYFTTEESVDAIWHCTITDSLGATAISEDLYITLQALNNVS